MKFELNNLSQYGVVKDAPGFELPVNAWSDGKNISFKDGYINRISGEELYFYPTLSSTSQEKVRYLEPVRGDDDYYWVYCTENSVWYKNSGGTKTNLVASSGSSTQWTSGFLEGLLIISNDDFASPFTPKAWVPGGALLDLTYDSSASSTWASVNFSARSIRTYKQYIIALDVVENGTRRPRRVRWSHPADPGAMPITWDETKPQYDAGYVDLDDDPEPVLDCARLRGDNIVYKYNSIHRMTPIGAPYIFGFNEIFTNVGIRSRNCVREFYGKHACFGFEDIIIHDGQEAISILKNRIKNHIMNNIDDDNSNLCIVAIDHSDNDIYFCYPETGADALTQAVVWNWEDNTTTIRDLNNTLYISSGLVSATGQAQPFDSDTNFYDQMVGPIDSKLFSETKRTLALSYNDAYSSIATKNVFSNAFLNGTIDAFVQKDGIPLPGIDGNVDTKELKYIYRVYIRGEGNVNLSVRIAEQMHLNGQVKWHSYTFNPSTDYKVDCRVVTRVPSIRISSNSFERWKIYGITIEYDIAGYA